MKIVVEDTNGVADLSNLTVSAPDGTVVVAPINGLPFSWTSISNTQIQVEWNSDWSETALPAGTFGVTVQSASQAKDSLTTVSVPVATGLLPTLTSPAATYATVSDTNVTFQWTDASSQATTTLQAWSDIPYAVLWQKACGSAQTLAYNSDHTASEALVAGHLYGWSITSTLAVSSSDARVTIAREGDASGEFVISTAGAGGGGGENGFRVASGRAGRRSIHAMPARLRLR